MLKFYEGIVVWCSALCGYKERRSQTRAHPGLGLGVSIRKQSNIVFRSIAICSDAVSYALFTSLFACLVFNTGEDLYCVHVCWSHGSELLPIQDRRYLSAHPPLLTKKNFFQNACSAQVLFVTWLHHWWLLLKLGFGSAIEWYLYEKTSLVNKTPRPFSKNLNFSTKGQSKSVRVQCSLCPQSLNMLFV